MMARLEDQVHRSILAYLTRVMRGQYTLPHHSPNGGKRSKSDGDLFKSLGTRAGFPDLFFLHEGLAYAIEVKTHAKGSKMSTEQIEFRDRWLASGGFYAVCRSIDDAREALSEWRIPTCDVT